MGISTPDFGDSCTPAFSSDAAREMLALRRSTAADLMGTPGPDAATLQSILTIAARVPDHRRVTPFRFILFEGEGRKRAGNMLADRYCLLNPDEPPERVDVEGRRFLRTPVVVAVVARLDEGHRTPVWEQTLTNGAVCMNMLLACSAYGFAAQWLTEWYAFDREFLKGIGLNMDEQISGFIYIGTAAEPPKERQRPVLADLVTRFA